MSRVKKILGLFGLAVVAGVTVVALGVPSPEMASAASVEGSIGVSATVDPKTTGDLNARLVGLVSGDTDEMPSSIGVAYSGVTKIWVYVDGPDNPDAGPIELYVSTSDGSSQEANIPSWKDVFLGIFGGSYGTYTFTIEAEADGIARGVVETIIVNYKESIYVEVPETGYITLFGTITVAQADYMLAGLIGFCGIAGMIIYFSRRKAKN